MTPEEEKEFDKEFCKKTQFMSAEFEVWKGIEENNINLVPTAREVKNFIYQLLQQREKAKVDENTSDGYHTFKELYEFRKQYNAALFNQLAERSYIEVYKSKRHSDGQECFGGGWFVVVAELPTGQISNHYELKDWDLFKVKEYDIADKWDGHTPQDVLERLNNFNLSLLENKQSV